MGAENMCYNTAKGNFSAKGKSSGQIPCITQWGKEDARPVRPSDQSTFFSQAATNNDLSLAELFPRSTPVARFPALNRLFVSSPSSYWFVCITSFCYDR